MSKKKKNKHHPPASKAPKAKSKTSKQLLYIAFSIIAIALVVYFVFSPSLSAGFVNWDDDRNIYENEFITSLNQDNFWTNTKHIFSSAVIGNYNPLSIFSFLLDNYFFGFEDLGAWHMHNILLHILCSGLAFLIARALGLNILASLFLGLLFGIHPMRVESVAWLTERKDLLFGFYYLLNIFLYIKARTSNRKNLLWLGIFLCFILSLLSKIQAVTLPLSFICIDYYFDHKFSLKKIIQKWPLFILSLIFGIVGIYFLNQQGSLETNTTIGTADRLFIGAHSLVIYLIKSVVPYKLSPLYPYPNQLPWYIYASILPFLAFIYALWLSYKKQKHVVFFGLSFFFVNIMFLLQFFGAGQGFKADRFSYIPFFGIFFILAYYFQKNSHIRKYSKLVYALGIGLIAAYSYQSFEQTKIWNDSGSLWTHVLKYYDNAALPYGNRANHYRDIGKSKLALQDYSQVIRFKPNDPSAYNSRAKLFFGSNNQDTLRLSLRDYNKVIELDPGNAEYLINRGAAFARLGMADNAIADFNKGINLDPGFPNGWLNRSVVHDQIGRPDLALEDILNYLKLRPYDGNIWYEAGRLLGLKRDYTRSLDAFGKAINYGSFKGKYYYERSKIHYFMGNIDLAKQDIIEAEKLSFQSDPSYRSIIFTQ